MSEYNYEKSNCQMCRKLITEQEREKRKAEKFLLLCDVCNLKAKEMIKKCAPLLNKIGL
jgi:hypothetical protein